MFQLGPKNCSAISGITLYPTGSYPTNFESHKEGFWPGPKLHFAISGTLLDPTLSYPASTAPNIHILISINKAVALNTEACACYQSHAQPKISLSAPAKAPACKTLDVQCTKPSISKRQPSCHQHMITTARMWDTGQTISTFKSFRFGYHNFCPVTGNLFPWTVTLRLIRC